MASQQILDSKNCIRVLTSEFLPITISRGPYFGGLTVQVVKMVAMINGFCVKFISTNSLPWGLELPNGTWNGVIGMINRTEADMTGSLVFTTHARSQVVDLSMPLFIQDHRILYTTPKLEPNIAGFILPFTPLVWSCVAAMLIGVTLMFMVLFFLYDTTYTTWGRGDQLVIKCSSKAAKEEPGWRAFQFTFGSLFAQSLPWKPTPSNLILISTGLWIWMAFVVGTIYRSNLKSMIILPTIRTPFNTLEEMIGQDEISYTMAAGGSFHQQALEAPEDSPLGQMIRKVDLVEHNNFTAAYDILVKGKTAAIANDMILDMVHHLFFAKNGYCKFTKTTEGFVTAQMSYAFQKKSPLKPMFDKTITQMKESGILDFLYNRALSNASFCLKKQKLKGVLRPLSFEDFAGMLSLYLGGIIISSIVFIVEKTRNRKTVNEKSDEEKGTIDPKLLAAAFKEGLLKHMKLPKTDILKRVKQLDKAKLQQLRDRMRDNYNKMYIN